jgi:tetratricopeptide (TPR) repeat protein
MSFRALQPLVTLALTVALACPAAAKAPEGQDWQRLSAKEYQDSIAAARAGDFHKAFDHALQAWQLDGSQPDYLWSAAREAQLDGQSEMAASLFRQWLALDARDQARDLLTKRYLEAAIAEGLAIRAQANGDHLGAQSHLEQAANLDPERPALWLAAAKAALSADREDIAAAMYRQFLKKAPVDALGRADAERWLQAHPSVNEGAPAAVVDGHADSPRRSRRQWIGLWTWVGAGALALTSGGFYWAAETAPERLKAAKASGQNGSVQSAITTGQPRDYMFSKVFGTTALVAAGLGAWLWFGEEKSEARRWQFQVHPDRVVAGLRF